MNKKHRSTSFGHFGYKCPHPDCDHIGDLITKAHCELHHEMDRDELFKKYGQPKEVRFNMKAFKLNKELVSNISNTSFNTSEIRVFSALVNN